MNPRATRFVRKMRGGAQAHLLECDDGHFYAVKFVNNPQHRRILINESVASSFLKYLDLSSPAFATVYLSEQFLQDYPEVHIQLGSRRQAVPPGWHFGSRYPGNPEKIMVYDFLPDGLLEKVVNSKDFLGALCFDKWVGNIDARQAIFFRAGIYSPASASGNRQRAGFFVQMIDQGYSFGGPHWKFCDSPLQGLYFRSEVYRAVRSLDDFQPWLSRVVHFPEEEAYAAIQRLPDEWLADDAEALEVLMERLLLRRRCVPDYIDASRLGRVNPFPEWR